VAEEEAEAKGKEVGEMVKEAEEEVKEEEVATVEVAE